uniref:ArsA/GET3 Anion-transporting ATPase-like domain-containing protein n=1 Tax=Palpitomonas bilix TaxID=652834 RepID=A0A7S3GE27_9EUKA
MAEEELTPPHLLSVLDSPTLKWIFVGGKGGVGKTTTSCSLALQFAKRRKDVLLVSTDPAHNLSDAFGQKFGSKPSLIKGTDNVHCMEVSLEGFSLNDEELDAIKDDGLKSALKGIDINLPGADEAVSFAQLISTVEKMSHEVVIFDTAPTGHTLKLLSLPETMEKLGGLFKGALGGMAKSVVGSLMDGVKGKFDMQSLSDQAVMVKRRLSNPNETTFIGVCIAEYFSIYETERLAQELSKYDIDLSSIVINQLIPPQKEGESCSRCDAKRKLQQKYIDQVYDLYEGFNIVKMPEQEQEVRGVESIRAFSEMLAHPAM